MRILILIFLLTISSNFTFAGNHQINDPSDSQSLFDLLRDQNILEVTLEVEVQALKNNRRSEEDYQAIFSFIDMQGHEKSWNTKVNLRGKFRRSKCAEMPPLKLDFKKEDLRDSGLNAYDDFKLVTHCVEDKSMAKELLLKEYLAYKIYNEITDYSFRVQFLKINYKDTKSGEVDQQWGFIIEDAAEMRNRLGAEKYGQKFNIPTENVNLEQFKTMALFQYMIGNLDWDLYKRSHNVKLIVKNGELFAIPYDFDFSGLVSAPYSRLNSNYKVKTIQDRRYLGNPEDLEDMSETINLFESKKKEMLKVIKACKTLSREERRSMINYLHSFFKELDKIRLPEMTPDTILSDNK